MTVSELIRSLVTREAQVLPRGETIATGGSTEIGRGFHWNVEGGALADGTTLVIRGDQPLA